MSDCRFGVSPVNYPDPDPEVYLEARNIALDFEVFFFMSVITPIRKVV